MLKPYLLCAVLLFFSWAARAQYEDIRINSYQYEQFSSNDVASINLYDVRNNHRATLIFLPVAVNQLPPASKDNSNMIRMYYVASKLPVVIDMLRHEAPIELLFWKGNPALNNSHLRTKELEVVGENEHW